MQVTLYQATTRSRIRTINMHMVPEVGEVFELWSDENLAVAEVVVYRIDERRFQIVPPLPGDRYERQACWLWVTEIEDAQ